MVEDAGDGMYAGWVMVLLLDTNFYLTLWEIGGGSQGGRESVAGLPGVGARRAGNSTCIHFNTLIHIG